MLKPWDWIRRTIWSRLRIRRSVAVFSLLSAVVVASAQPAEVSAGGNWMKSETEDKMTAAKKVKFTLAADHSLPGSDQKPEVTIFCTNGKLALGDFRPNVRTRPNQPGFWGQPQMRVVVRVDQSHDQRSWNWVNGEFLAMDKDTTREILGAQIFKVQFLTPDGPQIAEFSPAGLDQQMVRTACNLKPKKP
jgi:hypothetical protein